MFQWWRCGWPVSGPGGCRGARPRCSAPGRGPGRRWGRSGTPGQLLLVTRPQYSPLIGWCLNTDFWLVQAGSGSGWEVLRRASQGTQLTISIFGNKNKHRMKSFSEGEEVKIPGNGEETRETWQGYEAHLHGSLVQVEGKTKHNIIKITSLKPPIGRRSSAPGGCSSPWTATTCGRPRRRWSWTPSPRWQGAGPH